MLVILYVVYNREAGVSPVWFKRSAFTARERLKHSI